VVSLLLLILVVFLVFLIFLILISEILGAAGLGLGVASDAWF
jgi:hypothetical protein